MQPSVLGHYFEDFEVGETINHSLSKTIFESDNNLFSLLTMNHHPLHTNIDYCAMNQHGKILKVGTNSRTQQAWHNESSPCTYQF